MLRKIPKKPVKLVDPFDRKIDYLRLSVTDRCDLRCRYCMAERMQFLPKSEVLSLEELALLAGAFIQSGIRKIRLTGGEPLIRKNILWLIRRLGKEIGEDGLDELTLTTNASQLEDKAEALALAGMKRINISLDSLEPETFARVTRGGDLTRTLAGIEAAKAAGLKVKINMVALKNDNASELPAMIEWAHAGGWMSA